MKKGFTLVELSIVLVIIGLLIGGILVGQSLIDSARVNRLVSDLRQYEIATVQFQKKFKKYPGDSPYFIPSGNGDNTSGFGANGDWVDCAASPNATLLNVGSYQFWGHLSQSQMLKTIYPAFAPSESNDDFASCGGTHSWEDFWTGKISPYTKINATTNQLFTTYSSERFSILGGKATNGNAYFSFRTSPADFFALTNKFGSVKGYDPSYNGLVNANGINTCVTPTGASTCGTSNYELAYLYYFF